MGCNKITNSRGHHYSYLGKEFLDWYSNIINGKLYNDNKNFVNFVQDNYFTSEKINYGQDKEGELCISLREVNQTEPFKVCINIGGHSLEGTYLVSLSNDKKSAWISTPSFRESVVKALRTGRLQLR